MEFQQLLTGDIKWNIKVETICICQFALQPTSLTKSWSAYAFCSKVWRTQLINIYHFLSVLFQTCMSFYSFFCRAFWQQEWSWGVHPGAGNSPHYPSRLVLLPELLGDVWTSENGRRLLYHWSPYAGLQNGRRGYRAVWRLRSWYDVMLLYNVNT